MIVVASNDSKFSEQCKQSLESHYKFYEGHIRNEESLIALLKHPQTPIAILLLDSSVLGETPINKISQLLSLRPHMHIILFVDECRQLDEISAILFGAKAYCPKSIDFAVMPKIVNAVMHNEVWVDRLFVTRLLSEIRDITEAKHQEAVHLDHDIKGLTARENQIADLIANGATNRSIAEALGIKERTVKAHLGTIFKKMHVHDRLQLAIALNRHHLIPEIWHNMVEEKEKKNSLL